MLGQVERAKKEKKKVEHSCNDWGIEIVTAGSKDEGEGGNVKVEESEDVEGLMAELSGL